MTLAELELPGGPFTIRKAESCDVASIVGLLAADQLRASVDSIAIEHRHPYDLAFQAIDADPAQLLLVVVSTENEVVATMQLTFHSRPRQRRSYTTADRGSTSPV